MITAPRRVLAAFVVVTLAAAGLYLWVRPQPSLTVHAHFAQADGMFVGSNVAVLGVNVGTVEELEPRGDHVRITMSVPADTEIPAHAEAWVMSPNVVSDQYIELTPPYQGGPTLDDGAVIGLDRTHSPIKWDTLVKSVNELLETFGPQGANSDGSLGRVLDNAATLLDGRGEQLRTAIRNLSQATDVVGGSMPDVKRLLRSLDKLVAVLANNKSTVDSLTRSIDDVAGEFARQENEIANAIGSLSSVLTEVSQLVKRHGAAMSGNVDRLAEVSVELAKHQRQLVEIMDTFPLAAENITRAVTDDGKLRVRLDVSTNLSQFEWGQRLCAEVAIWLCEGRGIYNPIELPPTLPPALLGGGG